MTPEQESSPVPPLGFRLCVGAARSAALALLLLAGACGTTQRLSGPLNELPVGSVKPQQPGPNATRATVLRQAEGVRVQRPGAPASFALDSANPRATIVAGSIVLTAGAGRAEVLWDVWPASIILQGPGALRIGDKNAGEPLVSLLYLTRVQIHLGPGDAIEFPGGAKLYGDADLASGPLMLSEAGLGSLRLTNQSLRPVRLAVGELEVELAGGSIVEIPATTAAGRPRAGIRANKMSDDKPMDRVQAGSLELRVRGDVTWSESGGRVQLTAAGPSEVHGLGLILHLKAGESATIGPLRAQN